MILFVKPLLVADDTIVIRWETYLRSIINE